MAVDQSAVTRGPRPSKVKLLCSFGGRILPRPSDGALRYVGGHTRIVALPHDASLQDLMRKASDAYGGAAVLKYQLPGEDLDALVSVSSHEDLENMMEEYDKLAAASPEGSAKLRVFLFSPAEVDGPDLGLGSDDGHDGGQRYVDAVNGIADLGVGGMKRKESVASASSTSDGGAGSELADGGAADGTPPAVVPPIVAPAGAAASEESSRLGVVASDPLFPESTTRALPVNSRGYSGVPPQMLDPPQFLQQMNPSAGLAYVPQASIEPLQDGFNRLDYIQNPRHIQYVDPQQLGFGGVPGSYVAVPQHSYVPAVRVTTAMPTAQVSGGQPVLGRVETRLEDISCGGRSAQVAGDPNYRPLQALSQLPPLPPSVLQAQNVERHGLRQAPPVVATPGQTLRLEECDLCLRALPHAHSDPLIQDHAGGSPTMSVPNKSPAFYSLRPETASHALHSAVNGAMPDAAVGAHLYNIVPPHSGAYGYPQIPEFQMDGKVAPQKVENLNQTKVFFPPGLGFATPQVPHGLYFSNHSQAWSEDIWQQQQHLPFGPPQYLRNHDPVISDSVVVDTSSARTETVQNSELSMQDTGVESLCDYTKHAKMEASQVNQFETSGLKEQQMPSVKPQFGDSAPITEALHIMPPETSVTSEPWKTVTRPAFGAYAEVNLDSLQIVEENVGNDKPKVGMKDTLLGGTSVSPSNAVDRSCFKPVDLLPSSTLETTHLHNFQPGDFNQVCPGIGNVGTYSHHLELGTEPPIPPERLLHGPTVSTRVPTSSDWKDESSRLYSGSNFNDVSAPLNVTVPFQSSSVSTYNMHAGGVQGLVPSESLFNNLEPWQIMQNNFLAATPALKPTRVASRDKLLPSDPCIENQLLDSDESSIAARLEEGSYHRPLDSLHNGTSPDMICHVEGSEELVKQDLQAVANGLAASVLQQSIPVPGSYAHEIDSASEFNKDGGIREINLNLQSTSCLFDHISEEVKVGQLDKSSLDVKISEDRERLQIIKNSDLEELRELGSGTFGTVYHGKWRGSDVAIKRINDRCFAGKQSEQERLKADFWNEASNLADLHHPNVVAFYGVVLDGPGGSMATVTEYMVNGSLRQALQKNDKSLDRRKRLLIAMDVAFGMEYLHGKNIVHFDLKCDNLLVNLRDPQRPICKVGDLGLSKVKCQTLISGGVRGTLPWMAPELLNGSSNLVSEKVDVFSFGIVMWELLTGEEPYADLHYGAIIGGIVSNTLRPPIPESCDPEWRSLMERCWSSDPSERPSFTEIADMLRAMAASVPQKAQASSPTSVTAQAQR